LVNLLSLFFFFLLPPPPLPTLFPYTTLFRSRSTFWTVCASRCRRNWRCCRKTRCGSLWKIRPSRCCSNIWRAIRTPPRALNLKRSEEHTSELQSPYDLVCRLLLEKKKKKKKK